MGRRGKVYKDSGNGKKIWEIVWGVESSGKGLRGVEGGGVVGKGLGGSGKDMPPPNVHHSQTIINLRQIFTGTAAIRCGQKVY